MRPFRVRFKKCGKEKQSICNCPFFNLFGGALAWLQLAFYGRGSNYGGIIKFGLCLRSVWAFMPPINFLSLSILRSLLRRQMNTPSRRNRKDFLPAHQTNLHVIADAIATEYWELCYIKSITAPEYALEFPLNAGAWHNESSPRQFCTFTWYGMGPYMSFSIQYLLIICKKGPSETPASWASAKPAAQIFQRINSALVFGRDVPSL